MITRSYKTTRIFADNGSDWKKGRFSADYRYGGPSGEFRLSLTAHSARYRPLLKAQGDRLNYRDVKMSLQDDFMLR